MCMCVCIYKCVCVFFSVWLAGCNCLKGRVLWRSLAVLTVKDRTVDRSIFTAPLCIWTAWVIKAMNSHRTNPSRRETKDSGAESSTAQHKRTQQNSKEQETTEHKRTQHSITKQHRIERSRTRQDRMKQYRESRTNGLIWGPVSHKCVDYSSLPLPLWCLFTLKWFVCESQSSTRKERVAFIYQCHWATTQCRGEKWKATLYLFFFSSSFC